MGVASTCSYTILLVIVAVVVTSKLGASRLLGFASALVVCGSLAAFLYALYRALSAVGQRLRPTTRGKKTSPGPVVLVLFGPPGAGKTHSTGTNAAGKPNFDWSSVLGARQFAVVPEPLPKGVLADFEDKEKRPIVTYTFEHLLVASRQRDLLAVLRERNVTHIMDRGLPDSLLFHIAVYTRGWLPKERIDELMKLNLLDYFVRQFDGVGGRPIAFEYYATDAAKCFAQVKERGGEDGDMDPFYSKLLVFVYAYMLLHIIEAYPQIDVYVHSQRHHNISAAEHREIARYGALENLQIVLPENEAARFVEVASRFKTRDVYIAKPVCGKVLVRSVRDAATEELRRVQDYEQSAIDADSAKKNQ